MVTSSQKSVQLVDEGVFALFTELSTEVIQVQRPDNGASKVVCF